MPTLDDLLATRPSMSLAELTDTANALLPDYLPDDPVDSRVTDTVNARLIRHYTSEGVLDGASRDGKKAIYFVDHLLQLLALRRLLADGVSAGQIGDALTRLDRDTLRAIAEGATGPESFPAPPASEPSAPASSAPADSAPGPSPSTPRAATTPASATSSAADRRARASAALAAIRARSGSASSDARRTPPDPRGAPSDPHMAPAAPRTPSAPPPLASSPSTRPLSASTPTDAPSSWERVPLLDGVELHVRSDVRLPDSPAARQKLLDHVIREIVLYAQRRGS